jgi:stearoyl-CoA desaturase (delta-9 desaturase)
MSMFWMFLVTLCILQVSLLCTTIFLHRSLTHGGLELDPVVRNLMHLHIRLFTGISPREWVAVHRKHHHFTDIEGDPHSPYLMGLWKVFLFNIIYYKRQKKVPGTIEKYTPDYVPDWVDKIPGINYGVLAALGIFTFAFGVVGGALMWLFHVVAYVLLNSGVNSFCHWVGYRTYDNKATNFPFWAWITAGEGWHNNHHAYPSSPKLGLKRNEFDMAWPVIKLLVFCKLAKLKETAVAKSA